jgi:protein-L-isoaspartate(D-aspartate) O-methyltransferase
MQAESSMDATTASKPDVLAAQERLWTSIQQYQPLTGEPWMPSESLRQAYFSCPRHGFCHAFSMARGGATYNAADCAARSDWLPQVYQNSVLVYLDDSGTQLPSTNSEPAFILYLLSFLDAQPGQRVLEVGSGGGWLLAMLARLVGPAGHATGIELIRLLAERSRADIERLGIDNVTIVCGDGAGGLMEGAPFHRIIATAGSPFLPFHLRDQLTDGGVLLVPVQVPGGGDEVLVLHRRGDSLISSKCIPGWFVHLRGESLPQQAPAKLAGSAFWKKVGSRQCGRYPWSGIPPGVSVGFATHAFRAFLNRVGMRLRLFILPPRLRTPGGATLAFGLVNEAEGSAVLCFDRQIVGFGNDYEVNRLMQWQSIWLELGCPRSQHFALRVVPLSATEESLRPDEWLGERTDGYRSIWSVTPPRPAGLKRLLEEACRTV